jgi:hypothetical protein
MARSSAEHALGRALAWLRWSGVPYSPEIIRLALAIVEKAVAEGEAELISRVMTELPQHIAVPEVRLPRPALPIRRASLGYAPYL